MIVAMEMYPQCRQLEQSASNNIGLIRLVTDKVCNNVSIVQNCRFRIISRLPPVSADPFWIERLGAGQRAESGWRNNKPLVKLLSLGITQVELMEWCKSSQSIVRADGVV